MSEKEIDDILAELSDRKKKDSSPSLMDEISSFSKKREDKPEIRAERPVKKEEPKSAPKQAEKPIDIPLAPPKPSLEITEKDSMELVEKLSASSSNDGDGSNEPPKDKKPKKKNDKKKIIIIVVAAILIVAIAVGTIFAIKGKNKEEEPTTKTTTTQQETTEKAKEVGPVNPFTGESGYSAAALTQRPVAVVVENEYSTSCVRPQWALSDADIVLEGESEFSTRLLMFWADYNKVPSKVGPTRSARPPFIRFSQLFDSVFIHAGLSHSKGDYVGADTVFENENIDHINLLKYSEDGKYFGRDRSRNGAIEHTGYLNGDNVKELLDKKGFNLKLNENKFSKLRFFEEATPVSTASAKSVTFKWSSNCPKKGDFKYNAEKKTYTTTDFDSKYGEANPQWANLIFLLDKTEYIVKHDYKGAGNTETYCDYKLSGGTGMLCSQGTYIDITWGVSNGKLWMKDTNGEEIKLNVGKTYIGYGSSNHSGSITVNE